MFGITFQTDDYYKNKENSLDKISKEVENKSGLFKIIFFISLISIIVFFIGILSLMFFGFFYFLSFAWNNSFSLFFDLPTMNWLNLAFGYIFIHIFYKIIKFVF